jgi:hypothetical protein
MTSKNCKGKFGSIILAISLLCCGILIFAPVSVLIQKTHAGSTHIDESESDFKVGTLNNVRVTSECDVTLASISDDINDNFKDLSRISYMKNISKKPAPEKIALKLNRYLYGGTLRELEPIGCQTKDGGYIVTGYSYSYSTGSCDVWLIKINSSFKKEWSKNYGGFAQDGGFCVDQTTDGGYFITGITDSFCNGDRDIWVIKTNSTGAEEWNRPLGGAGFEFGRDGHQTSDGGYIVIGKTTSYGCVGTNQNGNPYTDAWLIKLNSTGHEQWNKTYGNYSNELGIKVLQTPDNGYLLLGRKQGNTWLIKTDENGTEEWNRTLGRRGKDKGSSIKQTSDGGYIITGQTNISESSNQDIWLTKINKTYVVLWNNTIQKSQIEHGVDIQQTTDGGYIIIGSTTISNSIFDICLVKTNSTGYEQWYRTFGQGGDDRGGSVIETDDGGYLMIANTNSYDADKYDFLLMKTDCNGDCFTNGTLISKDLLEENEVISIDSFDYQATIPDGCEIHVQFSQDNINYYNSTGIMNSYNNLSEGFRSIDLSALDWSGPNFYYKMEFYSYNIDYNPSLQNIRLFYKAYNPSGTLKSFPISTDGDLSWITLAWESTEPEGTSIKFKLRSAKSKSALGSSLFLGPNGDPGEFYTASGTPIWPGHGQDKWMQYIVYLDSDSNKTTPILHNVTFSYNYWPEPPVLIAPTYNNWTNNNKPTFTWHFNDTDSANQQAYQVLITNDSTFETINFDSSQRKSKSSSWSFPAGTSYTLLSDDTWYWKVKTQDSDGDWGLYSDPYILNIDTIIEKPVKLNVNSEWTNNNVFNIDWVNPSDQAGINEGAYYYLGDSPPTHQDDGIWMSTKPFLLNIDSEGVNNLYLWLEDNASNKNYLNYEIAQLKLDTYPPHSLEISINNGDQETNQTKVILNIGALDNTSGVAKMAFSTDGNTWSDWEMFSNTKNFELSTGDGQKTIYIKVMDKAGNIAGPVSTSIILNTTEPDIDTDDDGYPDDMDDFPNEPTQWSDFDGDNYGDNPDGLNPDAFPEDPNEWLDSDGDNYGDNTDEYPNDSTKWKKEDVPDDTDKEPAEKEEFPMLYLGGGIIIVIIITLLVLFLIVRTKKKGEQPEQQPATEQVEDQAQVPGVDEVEQNKLDQQQQQDEEKLNQEEPTKPEEQEQVVTPVYCSSCGLQKKFQEQENNYYCEQCQKYD